MQYIHNMPYYYNNIPYNRGYQKNRVGFVLPFALGFLSAPLLLAPYNKPVYPYYPNYPTYSNQYYYPYYNYK